MDNAAVDRRAERLPVEGAAPAGAGEGADIMGFIGNHSVEYFRGRCLGHMLECCTRGTRVRFRTRTYSREGRAS